MGGHGGTSTTARTARRSAATRRPPPGRSSSSARSPRCRDVEFCLERLPQARGLSSSSSFAAAGSPSSDSRPVNLFDGLADFSSLGGAEEDFAKYRKDEAEDGGSKKSEKQRREERPPVLSLADKKYKLGYGLTRKGVKASAVVLVIGRRW